MDNMIADVSRRRTSRLRLRNVGRISRATAGGGESLPLDVAHREVRLALVKSGLIDLTDLGLVQLRQDVGFSNEPLATLRVHGPIQTQFGYHLVEITNRTD